MTINLIHLIQSIYIYIYIYININKWFYIYNLIYKGGSAKKKHKSIKMKYEVGVRLLHFNVLNVIVQR